ncbi:MAG: DUF2062 domain-containing protein [Pseudomonadota bacterium]
MPKKYFRKFLPSHESTREHRLVRPFGRLLHHPNLWHLNRRSVAGGVAAGAFAGLIPGPVQMLTAAILAIVFRVNLPVAMFTTLYTNPFTFVPLYFAAYKIGAFVTGENGGTPNLIAEFKAGSVAEWIPAFIDWLAALGKPLLVGVPLFGLTLAAVGYFLVRGAWRVYVVTKWRRRRRTRMKAEG